MERWLSIGFMPDQWGTPANRTSDETAMAEDLCSPVNGSVRSALGCPDIDNEMGPATWQSNLG